VINQTKYCGWCRSLAVGLVLAVGIALPTVVAVAQAPKLGPQPDGSRVIRWPKGMPGILIAKSRNTLDRGISPGRAQSLALDYDVTGVGWQTHASVILSGASCYVAGAGATWQDDVAAQSRNYRVVPPDSRLLLLLSPPSRGSLNLSLLSQLAPDDLYSIVFEDYRAPGPSMRKPGDAIIPHLTRLTGLRCLEIGCTEVTAKGLSQLTKIKSLERLGIPCGTNEEALAELARLPNLKALGNLVGIDQVDPSFTDRGLEILAGIPTLEELEICSGRITDAGLAHLTKLPRLRYLRIWGPLCRETGDIHSKITDAGMVHVGRISSLKTLNISYLHITDAGLAHLAKLPNLEGLDLFNTLVTDEGMAHLKSLRTLKTLNFTGGDGKKNRTRITDRGVLDLCEIKSLESLSVRRTDELLPYLCTLPNIRGLGASSDADLVRISRVQSLESVGVQGVSAANLTHLARLKNLRNLGLTPGPHCAEYLEQIAHLKSLKSLHLRGDSQLTVSDLKQLNPLANLVSLEVTGSLQQDGTGLDLSGLTALEELHFDISPGSTKFADRDLATIAKLPNLRELKMTGDFSDEAKAELARSPSLKWWVGVDLHVIRTGQPDPWLAALRAGAGRTSSKPQAQQRKPR